MSTSTGPGRPLRATWKAFFITCGNSFTSCTSQEGLTIGIVIPVASVSWNASVPISDERTWPVMQTSGVESIHASAIGVTRFVAPGPGVAFGIPGGAILPTYDAIARGTAVRHVLARHEQGAGHMAEGYARASGKVGVAVATSGPGATNLVTPIADAWMDSTPLVCITGQVRSF